MRIHCPFCGERDLSEFSYLGDATAAAPGSSARRSPVEFFEAVYLRDNPAGRTRSCGITPSAAAAGCA